VDNPIRPDERRKGRNSHYTGEMLVKGPCQPGPGPVSLSVEQRNEENTNAKVKQAMLSTVSCTCSELGKPSAPASASVSNSEESVFSSGLVSDGSRMVQ
jgi:hypothetical protein